jgi:hypothetical protein
MDVIEILDPERQIQVRLYFSLYVLLIVST